jgi:hypothetical protein
MQRHITESPHQRKVDMKNTNNFEPILDSEPDSDSFLSWSDTEVSDLLYSLDVSSKLEANRTSSFINE